MGNRLRRRFVNSVAFVLLPAALGAQVPVAKPQFEVASVRPFAPDPKLPPQLVKAMRGFNRDRHVPGEIPLAAPDRVSLKDRPLLDLIAAAYSVRATQVSGPEWMADQVFEIQAVLPDGTQKTELNAMLQLLLEERFGLKVHRETQSRNGYALTVGKGGAKLKPAEPPAPPLFPPGLTVEEKQSKTKERMEASMKSRMENPDYVEKLQQGCIGPSWTSVTLDEVARQVGKYTETPVVDATGLTGKYSLMIEASQRPVAGGCTIFGALEKLGLKLTPRKVDVDTVVVDQVSKTPAAN